MINPWDATASGRALLAWEQQRCDEAVADVFGYHSLQLGMPALQGLRTNRMPRRWLALSDPAQTGVAGSDWQPQLYADPVALPFAENSLDLLVLPHTLELSADPHAALREVERVLMPEGRVLILGLNPWSLWGLQHRLERPRPGAGEINATRGIAYARLRDWLQLLALEVVAADFGCYGPAVRTPGWEGRWHWLEPVGRSIWPILGAVYCVVAVKRVQGVRLIGPTWRTGAAPVAGSVPVARHHPSTRNRFE